MSRSSVVDGLVRMTVDYRLLAVDFLQHIRGFDCPDETVTPDFPKLLHSLVEQDRRSGLETQAIAADAAADEQRHAGVLGFHDDFFPRRRIETDESAAGGLAEEKSARALGGFVKRDLGAEARGHRAFGESDRETPVGDVVGRREKSSLR